MDGTTKLPPRYRPPAAERKGVEPPTLLKLGGSLVCGGAHGALLAAIRELAESGHSLVVVPGGGAFAEAVRRASDAPGMSPTAAHWMAILAMDQMAYLLAGQTRGRDRVSMPSRDAHDAKLTVVRSTAGIARALERRWVPILAPFRWLRAADPLPHTWDVTSDSIAAWVAGQLGAPRLILLKSVDGVRDDAATVLPAVAANAIEGAAESATGVVDRYFGRVLAATTECWIINGRRPERLRPLIEHDMTIGTVIHGIAN